MVVAQAYAHGRFRNLAYFVGLYAGACALCLVLWWAWKSDGVHIGGLGYGAPGFGVGGNSGHVGQSWGVNWGGGMGIDLGTVSDEEDERHYNLTISRGFAAPDGVRRPVLLVNDAYPGPVLEVRVGQTLRVTIRNSLSAAGEEWERYRDLYSTKVDELLPPTEEEGLAIHWHGLSMRGVPRMDGAPGFAGEMIMPGQEAEVAIPIMEEDRGTHWWHSHVGVQRADGVYGGLIVRGWGKDGKESKKGKGKGSKQRDASDGELGSRGDGNDTPQALKRRDRERREDTPDHILLLSDHYHTPGISQLAIFASRHSLGFEPTPDNVLINGRGTFDCSAPGVPADTVPHCQQGQGGYAEFVVPDPRVRVQHAELAAPDRRGESGPEVELESELEYEDDNEFEDDMQRDGDDMTHAPNAPRAPAKSRRRRRPRLRLVNTGSSAHLSFSIDEHLLTVTEADGVDIVPFETKRLSIGPGQRYAVAIERVGSREKRADEELQRDRDARDASPDTAGDGSSSSYWIRASMHPSCFNVRSSAGVYEGRAVLRYVSRHALPASPHSPGQANPPSPSPGLPSTLPTSKPWTPPSPTSDWEWDPAFGTPCHDVPMRLLVPRRPPQLEALGPDDIDTSITVSMPKLDRHDGAPMGYMNRTSWRSGSVSVLEAFEAWNREWSGGEGKREGADSEDQKSDSKAGPLSEISSEESDSAVVSRRDPRRSRRGPTPADRDSDSYNPDPDSDIDTTSSNSEATSAQAKPLNPRTPLNPPTLDSLAVFPLDPSQPPPPRGNRPYDPRTQMVLHSSRAKWIELTLFNLDDTPHPFHLHGHKFVVTAVGEDILGERRDVEREVAGEAGVGVARVDVVSDSDGGDQGERGETVEKVDQVERERKEAESDDQLQPTETDVTPETKQKRETRGETLEEGLLVRDTITLPRRGWVRLRWRLDNPGVWALHCHVLVHMMTGMAVAVGDGVEEL